MTGEVAPAASPAPAVDMVNSPPHYRSLGAVCAECDTPIECIDVVEHFSFNRGNAIKYLWRAGAKGNTAQDLLKSIWYIQRELANLEKRAQGS